MSNYNAQDQSSGRGVKQCFHSITAVPEIKTEAPGGAFNSACTYQGVVMV
jgi:hypothetical protein